LSPLRTGFFYGIFGVLVALLVNFYFLLIDPAGMRDWMLAAIASFAPLLALAAYLLLAILAALRVVPDRHEPGTTWRSQLVRAGALAATVVGLMIGLTALFSTALQATVFADSMRSFAAEAAPKINAYVEEVRSEVSEPPPAMSTEQVEQNLAPPVLRDLGRSLGTAVVLSIVLGTVGGVVGALRGRSSPEPKSPGHRDGDRGSGAGVAPPSS
jgi:hypothetical protein